MNIAIGISENGFLADKGTFENEGVVEHELLDHPITSILDGINFWVGGPLGDSNIIIDEVQCR